MNLIFYPFLSLFCHFFINIFIYFFILATFPVIIASLLHDFLHYLFSLLILSVLPSFLYIELKEWKYKYMNEWMNEGRKEKMNECCFIINAGCVDMLKWSRIPSGGWLSKHKTLNSSTSYLRSSTLPFGHGGSSEKWIVYRTGYEPASSGVTGAECSYHTTALSW